MAHPLVQHNGARGDEQDEAAEREEYIEKLVHHSSHEMTCKKAGMGHGSTRGNTIFTCPYGNAYDQISHERSIHHHCLADEGQVRYGLDQYNARHDEGLGGELRTRCSDNIRQRDIYIQICIFTDGHDSETNRRVAHTDSSETKVDNIRHRTSISGL